MNSKPHIVCFGRDQWLLDIRQKVLATRFQTATVTSLEALSQWIAAEQADLILLCHTLSESECLAVLSIAGRRLRGMRVVLLVSHRVPVFTPVLTIQLSEGPQKLLDALSSITSAHLSRGDYPTAPSTRPSSSRPAFPLVEELHEEVTRSKRHMSRPQT